MTEYITIFEIPSKWINNFFGISILCTILGLSLAFISLLFLLKNSSNWRVVFRCIFFFIWGTFWAFGSYWIYESTKFERKFIEAYHSKNYEVAEGIVEVLHQEPEGGHDAGDLIKINGREIEFSYFNSTPTYHQTISHGGVLKEGVYAKVYLYKGRILRIDIPEAKLEDSD